MSGAARVHLYVSGIVQGVFFRQTTKQQADALEVDGWVRNLPDGRVEVVAEGPRDRLEKLVAFCHRGPTFARVDSVDVSWEAPTGEPRIFTITR